MHETIGMNGEEFAENRIFHFSRKKCNGYGPNIYKMWVLNQVEHTLSLVLPAVLHSSDDVTHFSTCTVLSIKAKKYIHKKKKN